ncbi:MULTISPECIES: DUF5689 domain-containing protein [Chitinophagaceae]
MNTIMERPYIKILICLLVVAGWGCEKKDSFPGAEVSPYIALFDLRSLYHSNSDVVPLTSDKLNGADSITGMVVSDHSGNNLPDSLLMLQDHRRLSMLRGIALTVSNAADYKVGDSIVVKIKGGTLQLKDGLLQIVGINANDIRKVSSGNSIAVNRVTTATMLANPEIYESTQISIVKGGPNPMPTNPIPLAGTITINDGFGNIGLVTNTTSKFADTLVPILANYTGVVMNTVNDGKKIPYLMLRTSSDITVLSSVIANVPIVISGFLSNPAGSDANYEYVQCLATQDIDFSQTPYCLVTSNNAGTSTPTGYPSAGWATGGLRTYKMNLTSGSVKKGTFFYIGGTNKNIDGSNSTSMASSVWFGYDYSTLPGMDFGTATANLLANSGNAAGIAIFKGTTVVEGTEPIDVVFNSNGGSLYTGGPPAKGYRIANTDIYDKINPLTLVSQPFYLSGTNTLYSAPYPASTVTDPFIKLGGVFNVSLGRWTTNRSSVFVSLSTSSKVSEIEDSMSTHLEE